MNLILATALACQNETTMRLLEKTAFRFVFAAAVSASKINEWGLVPKGAVRRLLWILAMCVVGLASSFGLLWLLYGDFPFQQWTTLRNVRTAVQAEGGAPPWLLVSGLAAAPSLLLTWWWRTVHKDTDVGHKEAEIAAAQRDERFRRFIEACKLLSDNSTSVRLGGIYALERLARDSKGDFPRILELLCAFVRTGKKRLGQCATDVGTAFSVIARLAEVTREKGGEVEFDDSLRHQQTLGKDLSNASLNGVRTYIPLLPGVNLNGASVMDSAFTGGVLAQAKFRGANLSRTTFSATFLRQADFTSSRCVGTEFRASDMTDAVLCGADLTNATFDGCDLNGADMEGAVVVGASFKRAYYDAKTKLPAELDAQSSGMVLGVRPTGSEDWAHKFLGERLSR
jgi:uncharacterized protein YjbI with pentapeptide repeats